MQWSRSAPPDMSAATANMPTASATVPDAQALLQMALQASWRRDRRVGRLRVAMRWLVWGLWRYGLPLLLVLTAAVAVGLWLLPGLHQALATTRLDTPAPLAAPAAAPLVPAAEAAYPATDAITLRLEPGWSPSRTAPPAASASPVTTHAVQDLSLKPENWLHSKEP